MFLFLYSFEKIELDKLKMVSFIENIFFYYQKKVRKVFRNWKRCKKIKKFKALITLGKFVFFNLILMNEDWNLTSVNKKERAASK